MKGLEIMNQRSKIAIIAALSTLVMAAPSLAHKEAKCVINDPLGFHARPAGKLAKLAKSLGSEVTITKGDRSVKANQLMKLMGMGVKCGDTITISVDGGNEDASLKKLKQFFANDFQAEF